MLEQKETKKESLVREPYRHPIKKEGEIITAEVK